MHTVGILGITGNVGKPTTEALVRAAEQEKIKLVIFHRQGKTANFKPSQNVELRVIDLDGPQANIEDAVKGINVFVSTVGGSGFVLEPRVVEALAKSPDLVTYMPPVYSTTWNEHDVQDPLLMQLFATTNGMSKAQELGLSITKVYTGVFDFTFFEQGFLYAPLKANTIHLNERLEKNKLAITTMTHLAQSITKIVTTSPPSSIKNKEFSVVTFWPTGSQLRDLYSKLHGKEANVKEWSAEEKERQRSNMQAYGPVSVGYMDKWENASWEYEKYGRQLVQQSEEESLEKVAIRFL